MYTHNKLLLATLGSVYMPNMYIYILIITQIYIYSIVIVVVVVMIWIFFVHWPFTMRPWSCSSSLSLTVTDGLSHPYIHTKIKTANILSLSCLLTTAYVCVCACMNRETLLLLLLGFVIYVAIATLEEQEFTSHFTSVSGEWSLFMPQTPVHHEGEGSFCIGISSSSSTQRANQVLQQS